MIGLIPLPEYKQVHIYKTIVNDVEKKHTQKIELSKPLLELLLESYICQRWGEEYKNKSFEHI